METSTRVQVVVVQLIFEEALQSSQSLLAGGVTIIPYIIVAVLEVAPLPNLKRTVATGVLLLETADLEVVVRMQMLYIDNCPFFQPYESCTFESYDITSSFQAQEVLRQLEELVLEFAQGQHSRVVASALQVVVLVVVVSLISSDLNILCYWLNLF